MKKEIKDILGLLLIVLPAVIFIFVWWFHSPMYEEVCREQRLAAQTYLTGTYHFGDFGPVDKQEMIDYFKFTDEDINPGKILEQFIEARNESTD